MFLPFLPDTYPCFPMEAIFLSSIQDFSYKRRKQVILYLGFFSLLLRRSKAGSLLELTGRGYGKVLRQEHCGYDSENTDFKGGWRWNVIKDWKGQIM